MRREPIFYPSHFLVGVLVGGPLVGAVLAVLNDRIVERRRPPWFAALIWGGPVVLLALTLVAAVAELEPLHLSLTALHLLVVVTWVGFAVYSYRGERLRHPPEDAVKMTNTVILCMVATGLPVVAILLLVT